MSSRTLDESAPLLRDADENAGPKNRIPARIARRLYISHFLSTWNSRVFEFGAVLYLATIFPGSLLPMSVYALTRGMSAIVFASAVGHYIDVGNRLQVVRLSIGEMKDISWYFGNCRHTNEFCQLLVLQRFVVALSCGIFYIFITSRPPPSWNTKFLVLVTMLACVEKLCSIMNLVSVEKDWVKIAHTFAVWKHALTHSIGCRCGCRDF